MKAGYDSENFMGCVVLQGGETAQEIIDIAEDFEAIDDDGNISVRPPGIGMAPIVMSEERIYQIF